MRTWKLTGVKGNVEGHTARQGHCDASGSDLFPSGAPAIIKPQCYSETVLGSSHEPPNGGMIQRGHGTERGRVFYCRTDKALPGNTHFIQPAYSVALSDPPFPLKSCQSNHSFAQDLSMAPWHPEDQDLASNTSPSPALPVMSCHSSSQPHTPALAALVPKHSSSRWSSFCSRDSLVWNAPCALSASCLSQRRKRPPWLPEPLVLNTMHFMPSHNSGSPRVGQI